MPNIAELMDAIFNAHRNVNEVESVAEAQLEIAKLYENIEAQPIELDAELNRAYQQWRRESPFLSEIIFAAVSIKLDRVLARMEVDNNQNRAFYQVFLELLEINLKYSMINH